jgi:hypothetical protein
MSGYEQVLAEIRASAEQRDAAERAFCAFWVAAGTEKATAGDLLEYAECAGLPITRGTRQGKLVSLGRWLGISVGSPIQSDDCTYWIEPAKKRDGYKLWEIRVEPKVEVGKK